MSRSAAREWITSGLPVSRASAICAANARCLVARAARRLAIEVQSGLPDRHAALVRRQRAQLRQVGVVEALRGVRVAADRRVHLGEVLRRRQRRAAGRAVDARPSACASRPPPPPPRPAPRSAARTGRRWVWESIHPSGLREQRVELPDRLAQRVRAIPARARQRALVRAERAEQPARCWPAGTGAAAPRARAGPRPASTARGRAPPRAPRPWPAATAPAPRRSGSAAARAARSPRARAVSSARSIMLRPRSARPAKSPSQLRVEAHRGGRAVAVAMHHRDRAAGEVAELVGQLALVAQLERSRRDRAVLAERDVAQQVEAQRVRRRSARSPRTDRARCPATCSSSRRPSAGSRGRRRAPAARARRPSAAPASTRRGSAGCPCRSGGSSPATCARSSPPLLAGAPAGTAGAGA